MYDLALNSVSRAPSAPKRLLLVCYSHLRWDFVFQRPHHLMSRAAATYDVVYFEEPIEELGAQPHLRTRASGAVTVATPVLPPGLSPTRAIDAQRAMLEGLLLDAHTDGFVFWYYTPMALDFSGHVPPDLCVYDCMDELSAFHGAPPRIVQAEAALLQRSDLVFTGGQSLFEAKCGRHPRVSAFPSSVDVDHFAAARAAGVVDPDDQALLPKPRIGFFGVIDERMDLDLVAAVAESAPELQFVMLGPVVKIDPASLPQRPNIAWLGRKAYQDLPLYMAHWDAAWMPFALNDATRFISPTKTPEFLAAGLQVASTAIRDVVEPYGREGLVAIESSPDAFATVLRGFAARPPGLPWRAKVEQRLAKTSWNRTWAAMNALVERQVALDTLGAEAV